MLWDFPEPITLDPTNPQELARHETIATTQRYTHLSDDELDRGYHEIFNR